MEKWIVYKNLKISDCGNIITRTNKDGTFKGYKTKSGYYVIRTTPDKMVTVHRLMAHLFLGLDIDDIDSHIHHVDRCRQNNTVDNLLVLNKEQHLKEHHKDYDPVIFNIKKKDITKPMICD